MGDMNTQERLSGDPAGEIHAEDARGGSEPITIKNKGGRPRNDPGIDAWSGRALRVRRIITGVSATKLGNVLDVSQSTVLRWEKDLGAPTAPQVRALSQLLGCKPEDLGREPKVV